MERGREKKRGRQRERERERWQLWRRCEEPVERESVDGLTE